MITFTCIRVWFFPTGYVSANVEMSVNVLDAPTGYWSYTKAFNSKCDYYIECDGKDLLNITKLDCYVTETNYSKWCSG